MGRAPTPRQKTRSGVRRPPPRQKTWWESMPIFIRFNIWLWAILGLVVMFGYFALFAGTAIIAWLFGFFSKHG